VGALLGSLALATALVAIRDIRQLAPALRLDAWRLTPTTLSAASLAIVTMLTIAPLMSSRPGARLAGTYFAKALAPFAFVAVVTLVVLLVKARRRVPRAAWVAHGGIILLLLGVAGSTFDRFERVGVAEKATVAVVGVTVTNVGVSVQPGPYPDTSAVVVELEVDGQRRAPSLVAYPERGGLLAETVLVSRPWRDIQLALVAADEAGGVVLEVRSKPMVELIWIGALVVCAGAVLSLRRRPSPSPPPVEPAFESAVH
jgi:cytochrome c biogenesis factor